MSYDLCAFRLAPGENCAAANTAVVNRSESWTADCLDRPIDDETRAAMQELADTFRKAWPQFEQFHPSSPRPWIELTDDGSNVQVAFWESEVSITMPYMAADLSDKLSCLGCCLRLLAELGLTVYDPQLDKVVTARDFGELESLYHHVNAKVRGAFGPPKPWWRFW